MQKNKVENISLLVLFAIASLFLIAVFAPFFPLLSLAAVFAILLHRPYELLTRSLGGSKNFAATLLCAAFLLFCIGPLFFLGGQIVQEAQTLYAGAQGNGSQYVHTLQAGIENSMSRFFPGFTFNLNAYLGTTLVAISNNIGSIVYQTAQIILETFLFLLAFFFFVRDGSGMLASFVKESPLGRDTTREVLDKMYQTIQSVIRGTFVNALIRWLCIWIAFYAFGIPNALLWSSIGAVVGAIPGLGTPFAFIPAVAYLYLAGNTLAAFLLTLVGGAVVILIDNVLTSYFFGKGLAVSPIFVLFSILGGVAVFGPAGFILGPLVLSIFLTVVGVYALERRED